MINEKNALFYINVVCGKLTLTIFVHIDCVNNQITKYNNKTYKSFIRFFFFVASKTTTTTCINIIIIIFC